MSAVSMMTMMTMMMGMGMIPIHTMGVPHAHTALSTTAIAHTVTVLYIAPTTATDHVEETCYVVCMEETTTNNNTHNTHTNNSTCTQCIKYINIMKNDTVFLGKLVQDVEYVCGKIYGPAAHECVNVTKDISKGLDYLEKHNATNVCEHLHYC
jgi:hypothetical protein